jgi:hypothetical protein
MPEKRGTVAAEIEIAELIEPVAFLRPDEIERRSRPVFPPQNTGPAERAQIEVRISEREHRAGPGPSGSIVYPGGHIGLLRVNYIVAGRLQEPAITAFLP